MCYQTERRQAKDAKYRQETEFTRQQTSLRCINQNQTFFCFLLHTMVQKQQQTQHGLLSKKNLHPKRCVHGCINHQIDVICVQHDNLSKADEEWGNTWRSATIRVKKSKKQIRLKNIKFTINVTSSWFFNFPLEWLSKLQMAQTGCNERQITQSCTSSTVGEVLRLYLLCPCQPLLHGDCFDKRAQHGFMCLFQSYWECKHCQPCKHTLKKSKEKACWIKNKKQFRFMCHNNLILFFSLMEKKQNRKELQLDEREPF